jgi:hypothetical protein
MWRHADYLAEHLAHPLGAAEARLAGDQSDLGPGLHEQSLGVVDAAAADFVADRVADVPQEQILQPPP